MSGSNSVPSEQTTVYHIDFLRFLIPFQALPYLTT